MVDRRDRRPGGAVAFVGHRATDRPAGAGRGGSSGSRQVSPAEDRRAWLRPERRMPADVRPEAIATLRSPTRGIAPTRSCVLFLTAGRAQADTVSFSRETPSIPTTFTSGRNNGRHSPSWLCQQRPNERTGSGSHPPPDSRSWHLSASQGRRRHRLTVRVRARRARRWTAARADIAGASRPCRGWLRLPASRRAVRPVDPVHSLQGLGTCHRNQLTRLDAGDES